MRKLLALVPISGIVRSDQGDHLSGAYISIVGGNGSTDTTSTAADGSFALTVLARNRYEVTAHHLTWPGPLLRSTIVLRPSDVDRQRVTIIVRPE